MKHLYHVIAGGMFAATVLWAGYAFAEVPEGYYDSLEGKSGVALKNAVKATVRDHEVVEYGEDTWEAFKYSDTREVQGEPIWWDMYSNERVKVAYGHDVLNIEHSVANSWWGGVRNDAYKDLFHLNPSNAEANNRKSNYPLGEIANQTWSNGVTFVGDPVAGIGGGASKVYEPIDHYKGDFARAFFYVFSVYDDLDWREETAWMYDNSSELLLRPWAYEMLIRWAEADPVSVKEYNRNEAIYAIQHNRNPFIDCQNLARHIWGDKNTTGFTYLGAFEPVADPDLGDDEEEAGPTVKGYWEAVASADELNGEDKYCLIETSGYHAMAYTYDSSKKFMESSSIIPNVDTTKDVWTISAMPDDMAVVTLTPTAGGYAIGISDIDGNFVGYLNAKADKAVTLSTNPNADGCTVTVTPKEGETEIFFSADAGKLKYNKTAPRFTTYAKSDQTSLMLFRYIGEIKPSGVNEIDSADLLNSIVRIYDINGRSVKAKDIDDLEPGLYIVMTAAGPIKFLK